MRASPHPLVVGIFRDQHLAYAACQELRHAGFRPDEIRVLGDKPAILDRAGSAGPANAAKSDLFAILTKEGVSGEEASYYQQEHEAGRILVVVDSSGHEQLAHDILYQHGAYDATARP